jgi:hypothetical protein
LPAIFSSIEAIAPDKARGGGQGLKPRSRTPQQIAAAKKIGKQKRRAIDRRSAGAGEN